MATVEAERLTPLNYLMSLLLTAAAAELADDTPSAAAPLELARRAFVEVLSLRERVAFVTAMGAYLRGLKPN